MAAWKRLRRSGRPAPREVGSAGLFRNAKFSLIRFENDGRPGWLAHAERLRRETGLVTLSRTDAALALLVGGLEAAEKKRKSRT